MKRIDVLDGWRAVAILLVLIHHVGQGFYPNEDAYATSLTQYGSFGVDIFFGLSGLLITKLLLEEFQETGSFGLRQFYTRRAFRILPPCFAFLAAYTLLGYWKSGTELVSGLLFFRNYVPVRLTSYGTGHLWSLAAEEHFYLIWPGLLLLFGPRRSKNAAAALALAFGIWRMVESQRPVPLFPDVPQHFRSDLRMDALFWGCTMAFILAVPGDRFKFTGQLRWPAWLCSVGIVLLSIRYYSTASSLIIAVLIPPIIAATLVHSEWRLCQALSAKPLVWVGRISYSLYLWQQIFLLPGWEASPQWWRQWPWNVAMAFGAATASYYLIEKPLIAVGRSLAAGLKQQAKAPESAVVPDLASAEP